MRHCRSRLKLQCLSRASAPEERIRWLACRLKCEICIQSLMLSKQASVRGRQHTCQTSSVDPAGHPPLSSPLYHSSGACLPRCHGCSHWLQALWWRCWLKMARPRPAARSRLCRGTLAASACTSPAALQFSMPRCLGLVDLFVLSWRAGQQTRPRQHFCKLPHKCSIVPGEVPGPQAGHIKAITALSHSPIGPDSPHRNARRHKAATKVVVSPAEAACPLLRCCQRDQHVWPEPIPRLVTLPNVPPRGAIHCHQRWRAGCWSAAHANCSAQAYRA